MNFRSLGRLLAAIVAFSQLPARPAAAEGTPTAAANDLARTKLRELLTASDGTVRAPQSPRFVSLREPSRPGTSLLIGWAFPGATSAGDRSALLRLLELLGPSDSQLRRRLTAIAPSTTVETTLDDIGGVSLLVIAVNSERAGLDREFEAAVLEVAAWLGKDDTPQLARFARHYLRPLARCVVELDSGDEAREHRSSRPKLYVVRAGDAFAKVARHFAVSEKALIDSNRLQSETLTPGQRLVLPR
jgi:hypothetical protein